MSVSLGYIDDFLREIDRAANLSELEKVLERIIIKLGFEKYTYWLIWHPAGGRASVWFGTYPPNFLKFYVDQKLERNDIIARHSAVDTLPFLWSDVYKNYRLTPGQKFVYDEGALAGIKAGASVPMHGPGMAKAVFSVVNDEKFDGFDKLFLEKKHELHLLVCYAHEKIVSIGLEKRLVSLTLTARELEILTWVASGKTKWETAQILSLSEETVRTHLKHIGTKFGANNTAHCIAIAIINGLITP